MGILFAICLLMYVIGIWFSPFPYWKTYAVLWKTVLFYPDFKTFHLRARSKQAFFLLKYILFCPLWSFLWYLDEWIYPEYRDMTLNPVFIMGQPRSGTTFLHRTLAADTDNFVALRHIEWRYPFICLHKLFFGSSLAREFMEKNYWSDSAAGRLAAKMHPNRLSDWEEDGIFFEECFLHHFFIFLRFPYPNLLTYLDNFPGLSDKMQDHILDIHGKAIQKTLFVNNGKDKFYLSKEVTSHNKFDKLIKRYPDAKFIFSFRHSENFMNSLLNLVRFSTQSKTGIDPLNIPKWQSTLEQRMRRDCSLLKEICTRKVSPEHQARIIFDRFTNNLFPSMTYIYNRFNLSISPNYRQYLEELNHRQKDRDRGYTYEKNPTRGFEDFDAFVDKVNQEFLFTPEQMVELRLNEQFEQPLSQDREQGDKNDHPSQSIVHQDEPEVSDSKRRLLG